MVVRWGRRIKMGEGLVYLCVDENDVGERIENIGEGKNF